MRSYLDISFIPNMFHSLIKLYISLPRIQQCLMFASAGIIIGMALLLVRISNAVSYLSDEPETCINCHVMTDAYASWKRGSHGRAAVCTDCHVPHGNIVAKYAFKGYDGMKHSYVFTAGTTPQVLELSSAARHVVQENCLTCHNNEFLMVRLADTTERACWQCHTNIHGDTKSLSASPLPLRPKLPAAGLEWMKKGDKNDK
jgi:cytochrome c nitrite reductase small subunit